MRRSLFVLLCSLTAALCQSAQAHHSPTAFDMSRVIAFEGTVKQFDWRNPHVYITVEDTNDVEWVLETDATPVLTRSGWSADSFAVGESVTVRARPHRNAQRPEGLLLSIVGRNGVSMSSLNRVDRSERPRAQAAATSLQGIWQARLLPSTTPIRIPLLADLLAHPLTDSGRNARAAYEESITPTVECIGFPTPFVLAISALYLAEFDIRDDVIVFRSEFFDAERIIHMDGRAHPSNAEPTIQGHSIGAWEGDTLVVDTIHFAEHRSPYGVGIPSGARKHVVERYTLSDDGTQLVVDILLEDPEYLAEPFSGSLTLNYSPHLEMLSVDCDPDVASRFVH